MINSVNYWYKKYKVEHKKVQVLEEQVKSCEDHAYFAGSEAMREKFVDKACEWLEENADTYIGVEGYAILQDKFFEDFRKAMEEKK